MLLDWVSLYLPRGSEPAWIRAQWDRWGDRLCRYCPRTGTVRWESAAWDSVRSDSHQIAVQITGDTVRLQGSPARLWGDGDNTFPACEGSASVAASAERMIRAAADLAGVWLPHDRGLWHVTRVDVTRNFLLPSAADVRAALGFLRGTEGGRYRVSATAGETVYWGGKSRLRRAKAYLKGAQLRAWVAGFEKRREVCPVQYAPAVLDAADRLLRLELTLGAQWWRERAPCTWQEMGPEVLGEQWESFFGRMVGARCEATMLDQGLGLLSTFEAVAPTAARGRAAFRTWQVIKATGWEHARASMPKATWYKHLTIMRAAGLGDADLSAGHVIPLRRRPVEMVAVGSWAQVLARAA